MIEVLFGDNMLFLHLLESKLYSKTVSKALLQQSNYNNNKQYSSKLVSPNSIFSRI